MKIKALPWLILSLLCLFIFPKLFPKALKILSPYIVPILSRVFNLTPQTSQIPDDWRHAIVTPAAKAPRTTDPNLFRPISLTSVVCKVLEAILKEK